MRSSDFDDPRPSHLEGSTHASSGSTRELRGRGRWPLLVLLVGALLGGLILTGKALRGDPRRGDTPKRNRVHGTAKILVRTRVRVVDARERPVSGARVMLAPTVEVMDTEEGVASIREAIQVRRDQGVRAWTCAIGTTDENGVVDLEYTCVTDSNDPRFGETKGASEGEFPFGAFARIDSAACGTVFRELGGARNVRYGRVPGEPAHGMAEAEFVIRCGS